MSKIAITRFIIAVWLMLTVGANAANLVAPGDLPASSDTAQRRVSQAQPSEPLKVFGGKGIVTAVKPAGTITINHEPIEGLMPAMEMMFNVKPATLTKNVRPGDAVEFNVDGKTYTIVRLNVRGHVQ